MQASAIGLPACSDHRPSLQFPLPVRHTERCSTRTGGRLRGTQSTNPRSNSRTTQSTGRESFGEGAGGSFFYFR